MYIIKQHSKIVCEVVLGFWGWANKRTNERLTKRTTKRPTNRHSDNI